MTYPLRDQLTEVDQKCAAQLKVYNPRKHNSRRARSAVRELGNGLRPILVQFQLISLQLNMHLGREMLGNDDQPLARLASRMPLSSVTLAREKGVQLDFGALLQN